MTGIGKVGRPVIKARFLKPLVEVHKWSLARKIKRDWIKSQ